MNFYLIGSILFLLGSLLFTLDYFINNEKKNYLIL